MPSTPELLLPAGTLKNMRYAFAYGADAVYAGQPRYSLRVRNNDFDLNNLDTGIKEAHQAGKKFFVTSNLMPHNSKLKTFMADLEPVIAMKPDALIMADPGLIMMVRERWPEVPVHLSVQANTVNYAAVQFWKKLGLERIILSRELSLDEIEEIRQQCPDIELEVFVHGALCIAYSGRCLLSGYFNHRDPNQGTCTNSCRWEYNVHSSDENDDGAMQKIEFDGMKAMQESEAFPEPIKEQHPLARHTYLIEEKNRPNEFMPISEDEHGTYIMNSRDLRAIRHIERLTKIGIDSFKIEGRTKSHYYVARTAQIYRRAIDDVLAGKEFDLHLLEELDGLANRGYTEGFYQRHAEHEYQNYLTGYSISKAQQFVGEVSAYDTDKGVADITVKNKFAVGDKIEVISPSGNQTIVLSEIEDQHGKTMQEVPGGGYHVKIPLPSGQYDNALLARFL
ncbi:MAG: tRNA 5-hydroxyuridine modification protein YegQ [Gammaproteobacteria bacterium]|nr:tRNA 5-hydroxyuridine modification protein YegQ [Gammaproteobacteria bacterium]